MAQEDSIIIMLQQIARANAFFAGSMFESLTERVLYLVPDVPCGQLLLPTGNQPMIEQASQLRIIQHFFS